MKNMLEARTGSRPIQTVRPHHVAHIVQHLQPGGIETLALNLMGRTRADRVSIISLEGGAGNAIAAWPRLMDHASNLVFMNKKPGRDLRMAIRLTRHLRANRVDVVHTHHVGPLLYGGVAARMCGARLIHTEHDAWHLDDPARRKLQSVLIRTFRPYVLADADFVAQAYAQALGRAPKAVVPNGIDCNHFHPGDKVSARQHLGLLGLLLDAPLIGCAARLERVKGVDRLLDAFAHLSGSPHLVIAGDGSERAALEAQARHLGIQDRVTFLGRVDDMRTFYRSLDIFCLPSRKEGMPLSPLEAQACNIPVVATDVGGTREAVCLETGRLVPSGDKQALRQALDDLLKASSSDSCSDFAPRNFTLRCGNLNLTADAYNAAYVA